MDGASPVVASAWQCCIIREVYQLDPSLEVQQSTLPDAPLASLGQTLQGCLLLGDLPDKAIYCLQDHLPVADHLRFFLLYWPSITMDQWVLNLIQNGHVIKLLFKPHFNSIRPIPVHQSGELVLSKEVAGLLLKGTILSVPQHQVKEGYFSTYFITPKKVGGLIPILNLKMFNFCIRKTQFKMETLKSIISVMSKDFWLASVDLTIHTSMYLFIRLTTST